MGDSEKYYKGGCEVLCTWGTGKDVTENTASDYSSVVVNNFFNAEVAFSVR